jgi:hypothetical protein
MRNFRIFTAKDKKEHLFFLQKGVRFCRGIVFGWHVLLLIMYNKKSVFQFLPWRAYG